MQYCGLCNHICMWEVLVIYFVVLFHSYDNAFIYSNASDWFFPDFVAIDGQGIHWILKEKLKRQGCYDGTC